MTRAFAVTQRPHGRGKALYGRGSGCGHSRTVGDHKTERECCSILHIRVN